jgi:hypothetical protein
MEVDKDEFIYTLSDNKDGKTLLRTIKKKSTKSLSNQGMMLQGSKRN